MLTVNRPVTGPSISSTAARTAIPEDAHGPAGQAPTPGAGYRPSFDLAPADAKRAVALLDRELRDHPPSIVINRTTESALRVLETGARLRSGLEWAKLQTEPRIQEYVSHRRDVEARLGIAGSGELRDKTVYGSLQWQGPARNPDSGRFESNVGIPRYGAIALRMDRSLLDGATFTPKDSFFVEPHQVGRRADLASIILDSVRPATLARLLERDDHAFVSGVAEHMRRLQASGDYIEAQIPAPTGADVRAVSIEPDPARGHWTDRAELYPRIQQQSESKGLPVSFGRPPSPLEPSRA